MTMSTELKQWLFSMSALQATPSHCSLEKELYDRTRGIEFLFRLGSSLQLPTSAMCTAATWFHRFYMRYPMEDFHRQDVAASCIFLATKTEECGRKLRDVARVYQTKVSGTDISQISPESKEVDQCQASILLTEEVLLEALCFDFVVGSPHAELADLFDASETDQQLREYAWSLAHDSYRTPLCILYSSKVIAGACYILAQCVIDGPNDTSLDARLSSFASSSLPTPPSHKPPSPNAARHTIEYFGFTPSDVTSIAEALSIMLEFYSTQDQLTYPYLSPLLHVHRPTIGTELPPLFLPVSQINLEHHIEHRNPS